MRRKLPWLLAILAGPPLFLLLPVAVRWPLLVIGGWAIAAAYLAFALWLVLMRYTSGGLLVDLGPVPGRGAVLFQGIIQVILAALSFGPGGVIDVHWKVAFHITFAAACFIYGSIHSQLREQGIVGGDGYVTWSGIEGFGWRGPDGSHVWLVLRRRLPPLWIKTLKFRVSADMKDTADELIKRRVPLAQ